MAEQAHRRREIAARVPTRTSYYNSFFLLRTEVVLNGQPAEIGCCDNGELSLSCRYYQEYRSTKPSVSFPVISARVEDILKDHGVFEVATFFCEDAPLFQVTFSSEYSLKKFLRNKKRVEKEMATLLSEMLQPTQQAGAPVIRIPTLVNATLFLMNPDAATKDCAKPMEVTLENHSSCMTVWKESEVFDFGDVFRVFRQDPTKLPDEGEIRLNTVLSEIFEVDEWVGLGLHLEIEKWQLNVIARDHWNQTVPCKQSMLEVWVNLGKASWSALVRALCEIGRIVLAKTIAYKFGATLPPVVFRADHNFLTSQEQEKPTLKPDQPSQIQSSVQCRLLSSIEHNDHRLEDKTISVEKEIENKTKTSENYLFVKRRLSAALSNIDQLYKDKMKLAKQLRSREKTLHALETMRGKQGDLEESIKLLKQDIQQLQDQLDQKDREIAEITTEANSLRTQLQEATAELVTASSELNRLKTEQDTLKVDLERERRELEKEQYKSMFKDDTIKELKGELSAMRTESNSKAEETGVLKQKLLAQSDEVKRLQNALHEAEQRKPALPEQPSAATVQQQLLLIMGTSDLRVELATAEEGRQEVERQLGALQRHVQFLEDEIKSKSEKISAVKPKPLPKPRHHQLKIDHKPAVGSTEFEAQLKPQISAVKPRPLPKPRHLQLKTDHKPAVGSKEQLKPQAKQQKMLPFPTSFEWRTCKDLPIGVGGATTVIINGKVYLGYYKCILEYTPENDEWVELPKPPVKYFGLAVLNNQLVLVGGIELSTKKTSKKISVFDTTSRQWIHPYPPMQTPRSHPSAIVYQHYLIVAGGRDDDNPLSTVEVFDTMDSVNSKFYTAEKLPMWCTDMTPVVISNTGYLLGGLSGRKATKTLLTVSLPALIYKATSQSKEVDTPTSWKTLSDSPLYYSAPFTSQNRLLAAGGDDGRKKNWDSSHIYCYDPVTNQWEQVGDLPAPRCWCSCVVLPSTELLVVGGNPNNRSACKATIRWKSDN